MPFGKYEICLLHKVGNNTYRYMYDVANAGSLYDNTSATGATPALDLNPASWGTAISTNINFTLTSNRCAF